MAEKIKVRYYGGYHEISEEDEKNGIEVRWAGYYQHSDQLHIDRISKRYLLGYIEKGSCDFEDDSEKIKRLYPGNVFFCRPYKHQYIKTVKEDPTTLYLTCFSGGFIDLLIERTLLSRASVINTGNSPAICNAFLKLVESFLLKKCTLQLLGNLINLISCIDTDEDLDFSEDVTFHRYPGIAKTVDFIRLNYANRITLEELAGISGYSVSRFQYLFRKLYGTSPIEFLINERIRHAKELMSFDDTSINEISCSVGYDDPGYFSRIFKKYTGFSPKDFRKNGVYI